MNSYLPVQEWRPKVVAQTTPEASSIGLHVQIDLFIGAKNVGFAGHFPQFALLPGVVQIDWAAHHARRLFNLTGSVTNVERLKFTCPIRPDSRVSLALTCRENFIEFRYFQMLDADRTQEFSQGRLLFAQ